MPHPLVTQLRFARSEFKRCLAGVSADDAVRRLMPSNSLSWIVGHLASQEQYLWVFVGQGKVVAPGLHELVGSGRPATAPDWDEIWATWREVTQSADVFLDSLTAETLDAYPQVENRVLAETYGTLLLRNIYHYWFHTGEAHATRQQMGHGDLPQFVGNMESVRY
jgi:uncharacterized damage-inducible protein DinB